MRGTMAANSDLKRAVLIVYCPEGTCYLEGWHKHCTQPSLDLSKSLPQVRHCTRIDTLSCAIRFSATQNQIPSTWKSKPTSEVDVRHGNWENIISRFIT